jgi:hypothetical protein
MAEKRRDRELTFAKGAALKSKGKWGPQKVMFSEPECP